MSVVIQPLITEKTARIQAAENKYAFVVTKNATKPQIRQEIERLYPEVKVAKVNTMIMPKKPKGRFTRSGYVDGHSPAWKKAVITLKSGEINLYEEI